MAEIVLTYGDVTFPPEMEAKMNHLNYIDKFQPTTTDRVYPKVTLADALILASDIDLK